MEILRLVMEAKFNAYLQLILEKIVKTYDLRLFRIQEYKIMQLYV